MNWSNCLGRTESGHLGAAVYFWRTKQFDVFHVNPPLTRMVVSVPISLCKPNLDFKSYSPKPEDRCEWDLGYDFLAANSENKIRWCAFLARCSLIPFLILGGYCGFLFSRDLYGSASAYLFLTLWCFSPFLLAWGATVCPDAVAAAMGIVALYLFRQWILRPTIANAAVAGIALGILPLTKFTWIIVFVIWPVIWTIGKFGPKATSGANDRPSSKASAKQLCIILIFALLTINLGYGFEGSCQQLGKYQFNSQFLGGQDIVNHNKSEIVPGNRFRQSFLAVIPIPLPAEFIQGIDTQKRDFEKGLPSYLGGKWCDHGWWYYYLYAVAIKEPLGTWCLLALSVSVTIFGRSFNARWRDEMVVLVPGLAILVFVSSQTGFSTNSRYVIPALPFFFIWISKVGRVFVRGPLSPKRRALAAAVGVALTWSVMSSLWVYPHSLSYFNELTGGPKNGGKHLLDSNFDWGQDLRYLKSWLDDHPDVKLDGRIYECSYPPTLTCIPETPTPLPGPPSDDSTTKNYAIDQLGPKPGWYAVSANYLYGRDRTYRYFLDHFEPVASAGYSICIYHISLNDANRVRRELGLPGIQEAEARQAMEEIKEQEQ